jgi:hypothetical protein
MSLVTELLVEILGLNSVIDLVIEISTMNYFDVFIEKLTVRHQSFL